MEEEKFVDKDGGLPLTFLTGLHSAGQRSFDDFCCLHSALSP